MFGVVLATLNMAPTPSTPSTAAMAALRTKPVPREAIVPTAMVRVDLPRPCAGWPAAPSPELVTGGSRASRSPAAAQRPSGDADPHREQQDAGTDARDGQRDPAVLGAAHDQPARAAEGVLGTVDQLG